MPCYSGFPRQSGRDAIKMQTREAGWLRREEHREGRNTRARGKKERGRVDGRESVEEREESRRKESGRVAPRRRVSKSIASLWPDRDSVTRDNDRSSPTVRYATSAFLCRRRTRGGEFPSFQVANENAIEAPSKSSFRSIRETRCKTDSAVRDRLKANGRSHRELDTILGRSAETQRIAERPPA